MPHGSVAQHENCWRLCIYSSAFWQANASATATASATAAYGINMPLVYNATYWPGCQNQYAIC